MKHYMHVPTYVRRLGPYVLDASPDNDKTRKPQKENVNHGY
jgi:hypothetical protein